MRTFIHIGQHKTGTTTIQNLLRTNKDALMHQGLYVPDSIAGFNNSSHFILNVYSLNTNRQSSMKEKLLKCNKNNNDYISELASRLKVDIEKHYQQASDAGCNDIIWTNEGLYLLNSIEEYTRLHNLFEPYSTEVRCIICFREIESFKHSYKKQLEKQGIPISTNKDSYAYIENDSWLFNYQKKKDLLRRVFGANTHYITYNSSDIVTCYLETLGYSIENYTGLRLNVTQ